MRRAELFGRDHALTARMVVVAVLVPVVVLGLVALVLATAPAKVVIAVVLSRLIGTSTALAERSRRGRAVEVSAAEEPELHAAVERLCVAADLPKPRVILEPEDQPNSWVVSLARGRSQLHVTDGLLEIVAGAELEAVVAHEIAHIAHRDAAVMTVVGGPAAMLLSGGRGMLRAGWFMAAGGLIAFAIGWLGSLGTRALSRYRELAADAGAAALTGNPAALASALVRVSQGLVAIPRADLREVASRDAFHLLPTARRGEYRLPPAHPALRARIERLERLERQLQAARPAAREEALDPLH